MKKIVKEVSVQDIQVGDILQNNIIAKDGKTLLIAKGTKLTENHILRIRNWNGSATISVETAEETGSQEKLDRIKR